MKNRVKEKQSTWEGILDYCKNEKLFLGEGNPNSKILLIGKEPGFSKAEIIKLKASIKAVPFIQKVSEQSATGNLWKLSNDYETNWLPMLIHNIPKNATWSNYQRLIHLIRGTEENQIPEGGIGKWDFLDYCFITKSTK